LLKELKKLKMDKFTQSAGSLSNRNKEIIEKIYSEKNDMDYLCYVINQDCEIRSTDKEINITFPKIACISYFSLVNFYNKLSPEKFYASIEECKTIHEMKDIISKYYDTYAVVCNVIREYYKESEDKFTAFIDIQAFKSILPMHILFNNINEIGILDTATVNNDVLLDALATAMIMPVSYDYGAYLDLSVKAFHKGCVNLRFDNEFQNSKEFKTIKNIEEWARSLKRSIILFSEIIYPLISKGSFSSIYYFEKGNPNKDINLDGITEMMPVKDIKSTSDIEYEQLLKMKTMIEKVMSQTLFNRFHSKGATCESNFAETCIYSDLYDKLGYKFSKEIEGEFNINALDKLEFTRAKKFILTSVSFILNRAYDRSYKKIDEKTFSFVLEKHDEYGKPEEQTNINELRMLRRQNMRNHINKAFEDASNSLEHIIHNKK
ncbi:MAG: hypothetical protein IJ583_02700, partial [Firmicutes bacterium]|nr:hypothetical protein [Bacillota bacterium]